jgi:hypothetical protein
LLPAVEKPLDAMTFLLGIRKTRSYLFKTSWRTTATRRPTSSPTSVMAVPRRNGSEPPNSFPTKCTGPLFRGKGTCGWFLPRRKGPYSATVALRTSYPRNAARRSGPSRAPLAAPCQAKRWRIHRGLRRRARSARAAPLWKFPEGPPEGRRNLPGPHVVISLVIAPRKVLRLEG